MAGGKLISTGVEFPDATTQTTSGLPLTGGALTGAVTTTSTFDGVDIATRDGVLTSTTTTANNALPKAGGTMTGTLTGTVLNDSDGNVRSGRKNLIINGGFDVSQRGDYTTATTLSNAYFLDRHKAEASVITATIQHTDVTINGVNKKALRVAATSTDTGYMGSYQALELANFRVGETYTVSCWVRSNNANTRFRHNYIGGVSADGAVFTNDGNWEKVSWTLDSTGTTVSPLFYVLSYNSGNVSMTTGDYIEFTELQLELGSVATDFEHRSYAEELALCQRYGWNPAATASGRIGVGQAVTTQLADIYVKNPVEMRTAPTGTPDATGANVTNAAGAGINSTAVAVQSASTQGVRIRVNVASGLVAGDATQLSFDAVDDLFLDAEL